MSLLLLLITVYVADSNTGLLTVQCIYREFGSLLNFYQRLTIRIGRTCFNTPLANDGVLKSSAYKYLILVHVYTEAWLLVTSYIACRFKLIIKEPPAR